MQGRLWTCGRGDVSTPSFGSHPNPISTRGAGYAHPILQYTGVNAKFEIHRRACNVDFLAENFASFGEPRFEQKNKLMHIMILITEYFKN